MQIRQQYEIFKNIDTPTSYEIDFTRSDILKIQVSGEGVCSIKVYGKIENDKDIDFAPMAIIQDVDYDFIDTITQKGVYTVSATGYKRLKIDVESTVATLTCVASEVVEV